MKDIQCDSCFWRNGCGLMVNKEPDCLSYTTKAILQKRGLLPTQQQEARHALPNDGRSERSK